jgi:hypothetical protein
MVNLLDLAKQNLLALVNVVYRKGEINIVSLKLYLLASAKLPWKWRT